MQPIGGRFAIERDAGAGGMARVYRARDLTTNQLVAVKLLTRMEDADLRRFTREVTALAELHDPAIPRYIAHGFDPDPWLAMEWLDGEGLEQVLARGPMALADGLAMARAVAGGLAAAHARGIIHRDVKPGNVFLVGGAPARAKLIDFGIARDSLATLGLTAQGDLLGTPLYMAPEQAQGELDIDVRVDVYALGTLIYTALTGAPPFTASTLVALLAKIAVEDPPSLAANAADIPAELDDLVARMLAKHRAQRPGNAGVVAAALDALADGLPPPARPTPTLRSHEQRVVSVLLGTGLDGMLATDETGVDLADGSSIVTFSGPESPGDLATRAVRYALGVQSPQAAIALATGRAVISRRVLVGEVIDRAGKQLARAQGIVRIDDDTAALVEGRFELERDANGARVIGERASDPVRTLLGKPTRIVGRDRELAAAEGHYAEVVGESVARAVLVFGEPGIGKSRFAREVARRLASRDDAPAVLTVRGEFERKAAPLAAIASALRGVIGQPDDEFLAELAGVTVDPSERLRAAREEPRLMFEQLREAWLRWLRAGPWPRLVVVEDLQWMDAQSLLLVDAALLAFAERPLLVLALGRPETVPPWSAHRPHELRLDPLPKRAGARLVREALGDVAAIVVEQIVARADGNPLFLEELVRAYSEHLEALPVGVVGTVQLRLDAVKPLARTALRIASVFGERFTAAGVAALAGEVGAALDELVAHELVVASDGAYAFRHALVRDAAYALLTDEDRVLAHGLAAEYLVAAGREPAETIAYHFERARRDHDAAVWFVRAAEHALQHDDLDGAILLARRALATPAMHGPAAHVIAEAQMWRGELAAARASATDAAARLPAGTNPWLEAVALVITTAGQLGDNAAVVTWVEEVLRHPPDEAAPSAYAVCLARAASQLFMAERAEVARRALARLDDVAELELGPHARARVAIARGYAQLDRGAMDVCTRYLAAAGTIYARVGAARDALQTQVMRGSVLAFSGALDEARAVLLDAVDRATALDATYLNSWARWQLGVLELVAGDDARAAAHLAHAETRVTAQPLFLGGLTIVTAWRALARGDLAAADAALARVRGVDLAERYRDVFALFAARVRQLRGDPAGASDLARGHLDGLAHRAGMHADVHLAGIAVALAILADAEDARGRVAAQQAFLASLAAKFEDPVRGALFLALPWNAEVLNRQA